MKSTESKFASRYLELSVRARSWRKFLTQSAGTTAAEYAILLSLVVCGLFIAGHALSNAMQDSFDKLAQIDSAATQPSISASPAEIAPTGVHVRSNWVSEYPVLIERSAMLLLLITCFYLVRKQRKVAAKKLSEVEKAHAQLQEQPKVYHKRQEIYNILSTNRDSLFNSQVQVQHLMSKRVTSVKRQANVARMKHLMFEKEVRHLLVCDESQHLLGIISDRDLYCSDLLTAEDVMTRKPITVPPNALVSSVISLMLKENISALPIVQQDRVLGMMTTTDLIMAMQCALLLLRQASDEHSADQLEETNSVEEACMTDKAHDLELALAE